MLTIAIKWKYISYKIEKKFGYLKTPTLFGLWRVSFTNMKLTNFYDGI